MRRLPRHEPEIIAARKLRYHGDDEKVATTAIETLMVAGVEISSRYDKADEMEIMRALVLALPPRLSESIKSMFCDSKASWCFSVVLRHWNRADAELIGASIEKRLHSARPFGHNGIDISTDRAPGRSIYLDANWNEALP